MRAIAGADAMKAFRYLFLMVLVVFAAFFIYTITLKHIRENAVLRQMIVRLEADSRVAEVLVTGVNYDEKTQKTHTTIKFLEYDAEGKPLEPRYFTFTGNIIQFQSLVVRFDDVHVRMGDKLRGKSAYLFWKVFMLDGPRTQEYEITEVNEVPGGYRVIEEGDPFEEKLWANFWKYALDPRHSDKLGVKNAQIEAPGTMFIPGVLYTLKIENDGGMRIDSSPIPPILKGEKIPE